MMRTLFDSIDLNLLRVFSALMRESNVSRAARLLHLSQPAASNSLQRLREILGDVLFERTSRGMRPTPRARELWEALQPHYQGLQDVLSPAHFEPAQNEARFVLAMSDYTAELVVPRLAAHLQASAPKVRIDLKPYTVVDLPGMLEREGVDIAVGTHVDDSRASQGLRTRALWTVQTRCVMRTGHPLAHGRLTLKRFLAAAHIDILMPGMLEPLFDSQLAARGLRRNVQMTMGHYLPMLAILAHTDFVAMLPVPFIERSIHRDRLCERVPPIVPPPRVMSVIWHRRNDVSPMHLWMRETIAGLFRQDDLPRAG